jgi:cystathionine beta-lyase
MPLRIQKQQVNALAVANWLKTVPLVTKVFYAGMEDHPDYDIHSSQATGGGCVICFLTGNLKLSEHIVTVTKLFKITVSFGSVNSLISLPCNMSHASIPAEVRSARELPEDLVRMSIGIEDPMDLIDDLKTAIASFGKIIV